MDQTRKRIISLVCVAALAAFLAAMPLLAERQRESGGPQASILSATVEKRTIETVLIGGGALAQEEAAAVTVPSAVRLTAFLVENGDAVAAGDPIARVDRVTVMTAITQVQETLDHLAEEIEDARDAENPDQVTARAGGVVKTVYAAEGDSVAEVMLEHGALAVLSLDGKMAVRLTAQTDAEAVTVTIGETSVEGRVESDLDGELVITVEDDGFSEGQSVQVFAEDGTSLGSGELYIHSPWKAVAYGGTVEEVKVREGDEADSGDTLMKLTDTGSTAAYQQLLSQRSEYEDLMLELFRMYQTETVTAPCDGIVSGVDEQSPQLLSAGEGWVLTLLANAPNGDDGTAYTNYLGRVAALTESGWELLLDPQQIGIADYLDLSGVSVDPAAMTEAVTFDPTPEEGAPTPVYALVEGAWQQIASDAIIPGDVLLFAGDGTGRIVWIVRVQRAQVPAESEPTEPAETEPSEGPAESTPEPTPPTQSETPELPAAGSGSQPNFSYPSGGGSYGSFGGTTEPEPEFELYALETADIAAVIPQGTMTLEITVDELDISMLAAGQEADITVDALPGQHFTGTITGISNTGTNSGGSSKYTVELTLPRGENMLAGMNASAVITVAADADGNTVRVEALVEEGTRTLIYTGYDRQNDVLTDPVEVTVGSSDSEYARILTGLEEGAVYYYASYDTLETSDAPAPGGFSPFGR